MGFFYYYYYYSFNIIIIIPSQQPESDLVDQIRQEKRDTYDAMFALLLFVDDVICKAGTSSQWDEQLILTGIETKVGAVINAFSPGLDIKSRTERAGRLRIVVQRFLSKALGY